MRARLIVISLVALFAAGACGSLDAINPFADSGPKMAELASFQPSAQARVVWRESTGKGEGHVFYPAVSGSSVYAADAGGRIVRVDEGRSVWRINTRVPLSTGVGTDGKLVVVASPEGDVLAFSAADGTPAWTAQASSEVLSPPVVAEGLVIVRSSDNSLAAYDAADGRRKWLYQRPAPALSLRMTAPPIISGNYVFAGFPGGKLIAVSLNNGVAVWEGTVALPKGTTELERVADITSAPVIVDRTICAVAFQGRVACFDLSNGNLLWARDMSSWSGLTMDSRHLFVTDDKGAVHALDLASGASVWKQDALHMRRVSAPLLLRGDLVAVADVRGVVHFLKREDGALAARINTDGGPVLATPQAFENGLLIQTSKGGLYAIDVDKE
ncbi:MAG: outer membrane protein assembly factor BamB [Candidatus Accumulibacter sp.]|jgi:outer membrane protein assembly factor BamB|nr:outer membrane protein assembly factor BamB [Accumulibacter sp.]